MSKILGNLFTRKNIILYILALGVSIVNIGQDVSPFSLALVAACFANQIPVIGVVAVSIIGAAFGYGASGILNYILTLLIFMATFYILKPKYNEENRNEKIKLAANLFISTFIVGIARLLVSDFTIYELLMNISTSIIACVFYKIFVNSIPVIHNFYERKAFSIEEVIGASLLISIAVAALGGFQIFGFSVRNILSILIVLVLGWKNGILIGTTSGVTIGVTLGIIANNEPVMIAAYAISGMIAGILNKFGKIGVIVGFLVGNGVLAYVSNGGTSDLILFKEILIASIGLLAMPKNINIDIEDFVGTSKFLPVVPERALNRSKEVVEKLNTVSDAIQDMADKYRDVAVTTIEEEDIVEKNKQIFITELLNRLDGLEENMLYDDMSNTESDIINELFTILNSKQEITREDLLKTFAKFNNYIIGFDDENVSQFLEMNIKQIVKAVNDAYKISKVNFIWSKKFEEEKKNMQAQLDGVSKAISNIAQDMENDINEKPEFEVEKEKITIMLKQKGIFSEDISIKRGKNDRYFISLYIKEFKQNLENNEIEKIEKVLTDIFNEKIVLSGYINNNHINFCSDDKYICSVGLAQAIKNNSPVSGDSILQIKLNDGKYLIAVSDGMGSGPEARKSSQIAIKMLERLLKSGFDRETSIDLINTTILNTSEEIFATLDIVILDLYSGNIEFIKNGACPTYIKNKKKVQLIKSMTLPAGIMQNVKLAVFDKDIEDGDTMLMCSDGVLDSNIEYKNKELWIKYLLEDIETDNAQKIADIVLNEAIDNNFGISKDDMSVIVCKLQKK